MIEVYMFYLVFLVQILILSVLHPNMLARRVSRIMKKYPPATHPKLYAKTPEICTKILQQYRWLNHAIAAVGLMFLAGFFWYMQRPGWDDGPVEALVGLYFFIQMVPLMLRSWMLYKFYLTLRKTEGNPLKTASLQRRSLFDFVSPAVVLVTGLLYPAFVVYLLYLQRHPFPGFAGLGVNLTIITMMYVGIFCLIYFMLFGKKAHPNQSQSERLFSIEVNIKIAVYSCLAGTLFLALNFTLVKLDRQSLEPLAESLYFVILALLYFHGMSKPPEQLDFEGYRGGALSGGKA